MLRLWLIKLLTGLVTDYLALVHFRHEHYNLRTMVTEHEECPWEFGEGSTTLWCQGSVDPLVTEHSSPTEPHMRISWAPGYFSRICFETSWGQSVEFPSLHLNLGLQNHSNSGTITNQMHDFVSDMVCVLLMVSLLMLEDWIPRDTNKAHRLHPGFI